MKIFGFNFGKNKKDKKINLSKTFENSSDDPVDDDKFKSFVYTCTNAISSDVGVIDFKLTEDGGDGKEITNHPLLQLLNNPNSAMTKFILIQTTSQHLTLYGEAYWKISPRGMQPVEIMPLHPEQVTIKKGTTDYILGYDYVDGTKTVFLDVEEVVRFIVPDPNDPLKGRGLLSALKDNLKVENYAVNRQIASFKNRSIPAGVITTDQELTKEQVQDVARSWNNSFKSVQNAGKTGILHSNLKFQAISQSLKELEMLPLRKFNQDQIMAIFRVSGAILGIQESSNRATAEANDYTFARRVIKPQMQTIVDSIQKWLLPKFKNSERYILTFSDPVPKDKEFEVKALDMRVKMPIMTINEARESLGLDTVDNGDQIFRMLGQVPLGQMPDDTDVRDDNEKRHDWKDEDQN